MKKLVYIINCGYLTEEKGVIKKVASQKLAFQKLGYEVILYQLNRYKNQLVDFESMAFECRNIAKMNRINKPFYYFKSMNELIKEVKCECPDIIYIRDALWFFNLYTEFSKIAPLFVEVQSNIFDELKITHPGRYCLERALNRSYFKNISGLICITDEICKYEIKLNNKPSFILGNGIDISEVKFTPRKTGDDRINLMVIGSPRENWHGFERLIYSYINSKNRDKFVLHIVGINNIFKIINENIKFYGFVSDSKKLNELFSVTDIGIGTLALYKKNMSQAAPLKVRHYMAKGLPVIIGYEDIDLGRGLPFILNVPNDNSQIDFVQIERFYYDAKEYRESGYISKFTRETLTWDSKIAELANFIESVI